MSDESKRSHLEVGVVGRAHGILGEVKVRLHNPGSDALTHVETVRLVQGTKQSSQRMTRVRSSSAGSIVAFAGVTSREQAETLRGARVLVARSELPPLEPGAYYLVDLIGCKVVIGDKTLGTAVAVRPDPTVDTLVIELTGGGRVEQPILEPWILRVDVAEGTVELASDDGLIS